MSEEKTKTSDYALMLLIKRCEDVVDAVSGYLAFLPDIGDAAKICRELEARAEYTATVMREVFRSNKRK